MSTIQYGCIRTSSANAKTGEVQEKIKGLTEKGSDDEIDKLETNKF